MKGIYRRNLLNPFLREVGITNSLILRLWGCGPTAISELYGEDTRGLNSLYLTQYTLDDLAILYGNRVLDWGNYEKIAKR